MRLYTYLLCLILLSQFLCLSNLLINSLLLRSELNFRYQGSPFSLQNRCLNHLRYFTKSRFNNILSTFVLVFGRERLNFLQELILVSIN